MNSHASLQTVGWGIFTVTLAVVGCSTASEDDDGASGSGGVVQSGGSGGAIGGAGSAGASNGSGTSGSGGNAGNGGPTGGGGGKAGSAGAAGAGAGGIAGTSGTTSAGATNGGAGATNSGGASGAGGSVSGSAGAAGESGTGGSAGSGGGAMTGRPSACQSGSSYPAPVLSGTPRLIKEDTGGSDGTYEGPVWLSASTTLLFSDITFQDPVPPSQLLKLTPPSTVAPYLADSGTNGIAVDSAGVVYACSQKVQGIVKLEGTTLSTVVNTYDSKHFNSPNDLVIRSDGTIYFTDPDYQLGNRTSETGKKGVYRVTPSGTVSVVDDTFEEPNGITLSPDETVLYVGDYPRNAVRSFMVAADGSTSGRRDFVTVTAPDGFTTDCLGNLYVASGSPGNAQPGNGGTVEVISPTGNKLGSVTVAPKTSNVAFGDAGGKTLYITAGKALYALDMNLPGYFY